MLYDNRQRTQTPYMILNHRTDTNDLVKKCIRWIKDHLEDDFRLDDLASFVTVSTRTLIRHFRRYTGVSPQEYIQKLRIEKSKLLLETTTLSINEIINKCGYYDESSFRRLFKRHTHLSPRDYRRQFSNTVMSM